MLSVRQTPATRARRRRRRRAGTSGDSRRHSRRIVGIAGVTRASPWTDSPGHWRARSGIVFSGFRDIAGGAGAIAIATSPVTLRKLVRSVALRNDILRLPRVSKAVFAEMLCFCRTALQVSRRCLGRAKKLVGDGASSSVEFASSGRANREIVDELTMAIGATTGRFPMICCTAGALGALPTRARSIKARRRSTIAAMLAFCSNSSTIRASAFDRGSLPTRGNMPLRRTLSLMSYSLARGVA